MTDGMCCGPPEGPDSDAGAERKKLVSPLENLIEGQHTPRVARRARAPLHATAWGSDEAAGDDGRAAAWLGGLVHAIPHTTDNTNANDEAAREAGEDQALPVMRSASGSHAAPAPEDHDEELASGLTLTQQVQAVQAARRREGAGQWGRVKLRSSLVVHGQPQWVVPPDSGENQRLRRTYNQRQGTEISCALGDRCHPAGPGGCPEPVAAERVSDEEEDEEAPRAAAPPLSSAQMNALLAYLGVGQAEIADALGQHPLRSSGGRPDRRF